MKRLPKTTLTSVFWLAVWYAASRAVGMELLLPSPFDVLLRLFEQLQTCDFWASIGVSMSRILLGFAAAFITGAALAWAASRVRLIRDMLAPAVGVITAMPVASFVILALVWVKSAGLATVCVFMMCLPIAYTNLLAGFRAPDPDLLEVAKVFGFSRRKTFFTVRLPSLLPHLTTALRVGIGFAWKSGIAGEVIAIPRGTIGASLYASKVVLDTTGVLTWTATIVIFSIIVERIVGVIAKQLALYKSILGTNVDISKNLATDVYINNLEFFYGKKPVFNGFSANFAAGTATALMGLSGSGKTTLLRLVAGLLHPADGAVMLTSHTGEKVPRGAAFVFQENRLLPQLSVLENVEVVGIRYAATLLDELGLGGELASMPSSLSGGMARRVALARALAYEGSPLLLLDEPFSGLDDASRERAAACILRHRRGRTILLATHDVADAALLNAQILQIGVIYT